MEPASRAMRPVDPPMTPTADERPAACGLGVVTLAAQGDGVAGVSRLLAAALAEVCAGPPQILELSTAGAPRTGPRARLRFAARLLARQAVQGGPAWWMFAHLGPARAQLRVPRRIRRPYAVFLHGTEAWDRDLSSDRLETLRGASLLLSNSAYTASRVAAAHPALPPITPCALGRVPGGSGGAVDAQLLSQATTRSVMILGRMAAGEQYKGHDALLECWDAVRAAVPGAQLIVTGGGDDAGRLRARAASLGLDRDVLFTGRVDDATRDAMLDRVRGLVMPSRDEGFGLAYLDAMRAGRACVGLRGSAAEEMVLDGTTGWLVEPGDGRALAAAVIELLRDESRALAMGAAGRRRYEEHFTYAAFRDRLGRVLAGRFPARRAAATRVGGAW